MSNQTKDAEFPANLLEVEGDLLKLTEGAIVQQCNCLTRYAHGLSAAIAKKFPYGDPYIKRSGKGNLADCPSEPGSVMYLSNGDKDPVIVCMMAQWEMSKPGRYKRKPCPDGPDNRENRIKWFKQCLDIMGHSKELKDVNFPHTIGCGLAGGHWPTYRKMIIQYAIDNPEINVKIVRLV